ncbi:hypothetical protein ACFLTI_07430 [Bacteroidota bacterium]
MGSNSGHVTLYLDMIEAVKTRVDIEPIFILPFRDKSINNILNAGNIKYFEIKYSNYENKLLMLKLPFFRLIIKEIIYFTKYRKICKQLNYEKVKYCFYNGPTLSIGKYFLRSFRKSNIMSFRTIYGIGLRNPIYLQQLTENLWHTERYNTILNLFISIEKYIYILLLKITNLLPHNNYSKFNDGVCKILVKTNYDKYLFYKNGIPEKKLIVVGSIWSYKVRKIINSMEINISANHKKKSVLIILQPVYHIERLSTGTQVTYFKNLKKLLESLVYNSSNKYKIIAKFHPRDEINKYEAIIKYFSNKIRWIKHNDQETLELIYSSELIIGQSSTVLLDAELMKKQYLFYKFSEIENAFFDYTELFIKLPLYQLNASIEENIRLAKSVEPIRDELEKRLEPIDFEKEFGNFLLHCNNYENALI